MNALSRLVTILFASAILSGCVDSEPSTSATRIEKNDKLSKPSFVTVAPEPKTHMWWLRAEYHPFGDHVRGIPIRELNDGWCKANEFTRELFPQELLKLDGEDILRDAGNSFSLTEKFDGENVLTALVGAYETCSKVKGTFLLIIKSATGGSRPINVYLEQFPQMQQFASLRKTAENGIDLWWCYRCGHHQELIWDKTKKKFIWKEDKKGK